MPLPPVQPASFSEIYVSGDVIIHDSAVVAPGTILQAAPNSRIVVGAGACIGMGVILNAYQGAIEIETGAVLGSGVLILGTGKIGKNACVGSLTTILNASIEPTAVITAGSVIGDTSRQITIATEPEVNGNSATEQSTSSAPNSQKTIHQKLPLQTQKATVEPESDPWNSDFSSNDNLTNHSRAKEPDSATETVVEVTTQRGELESQNQSQQTPIVGQVYINQLMLTLFPERRFFQNLAQKNQEKNTE